MTYKRGEFNDGPWDAVGLSDGNFMTPHIMKRGRTGDYAWEISRGEGMDREPIFGVTFLRWNHDVSRWERDFDHDALRWSLASARELVAEVTGAYGEEDTDDGEG